MSVGETERRGSPMVTTSPSAQASASASSSSGVVGSRKQRSVSSNTLAHTPTSPGSPNIQVNGGVSTAIHGHIHGQGQSHAQGQAQTRITLPNSETPSPPVQPVRRSSFGMNFLSSITNSMRTHPSIPSGGDESTGNGQSPPTRIESPHHFMSNSPTIANLHGYSQDGPIATAETAGTTTLSTNTGAVAAPGPDSAPNSISVAHSNDSDPLSPPAVEPSTGAGVGGSMNLLGTGPVNAPAAAAAAAVVASSSTSAVQVGPLTSGNVESDNGMDKDGFFSLRLTPLIDHSSSTSGLYFAPIIRKIKPKTQISIGRYTEKNKSAAHAPQGSSAPVVFKSKVVSRTHALFQCNDDGQWFLKDCKSSSGTFLNHIRLSPASQESTLMPLIDGDIIQLGMDYRGGTEEVYRCVKMRCEFNKSWQRKVNQFNLEIHKKLKNLAIGEKEQPRSDGGLSLNPIASAVGEALSECAICLLQLEPCQALFISPCSHSWHYKCIRPIIIKSYPQFYCPNCRSMCDLETDIEDDD
ncbi:E3 ubiquitin-protein ligase Dma2p [[Candida] railenensis]|uniref:E3 ubiquitin-protein ligase Dma2p n=1 Tax=[Candida] railenensis TaxID=45579 RepID=A0A9P0W1N9_9ASCO|nr:E3 ubiquitin-protein ligase Dma2p [[Candida] railenensis]